MNLLKYVLLIFILLGIDLLANQKIILQLNWKHQFQFAGYYMAKEMGYYKDIGLDVEFKEFDNSTNTLDLIKDNKVNFAIGRSSILIDYANGEDIVALASILQKSPLMLLVTNNNIHTLNDLKNKNIMITADAKSSASIIAMLNANNIKINDLNVQPHSYNINDLIDKKTDAMASYLSNESIILDNKNISYKIFHPKDYGFDFYSDILFTSSKFVKNNPKLTKDFYEASIKGWKYAFNNISKTSKIIFEKYNTQNNSIIHYIQEAEVLSKLIYHEGTNLLGCLDKEKLKNIIDVYKIIGFIKKDRDLKDFIYEHNAHKEFELKIFYNDLFVYLLLSILSLLLIITLVIYFIIKKKWLHTQRSLEEEVLNKTKKIKELTYIDALTNTKNRRAYDEKIEELISIYKRYDLSFSLAMFDIDDFKKVNDTYGHHVGDIVLQDLSKLVKSNIRSNDYLFRVGGEEFVILFHHNKLDKIQLVAQKIVKKVEDELQALNKHNITISMGLAIVAEDDTIDSIYKRADKLLYQAKKNGKNKLCY